jgi:hypothetical protein
MSEAQGKIRVLLRQGSKLTGEVVGGAAIGFLFGGPLGAGAGAVTPLVVAPLKKVLSDVAERWLSTRESLRVSAGANYAAQKIAERLDAGAKIREDAFFAERPDGRSTAEELFEATLLKCKNEAEEKKCRFIGNIFANAVFMEDVAPSTVTYLLQRAEQLTYRQVCLLALVARAEEIGCRRPWGRVMSKAREHPDHALIAEVQGLGGLVHAIGNTEEPPFLEPLGYTLYTAMSLDEVPREELADVAATFFRG